MIPIPKCLWSKQCCSHVCIYQQCQLLPFICKHCEDYYQCQTIHMHHGKRSTKKWSEIASLFENYLKRKSFPLELNKTIKTSKIDQYYESNQYIIKCLQNKEYSKITGKKMRSLYDLMVDYIQTQKLQSTYQKQYQEQKLTDSLLQQYYFSEGQKIFKQRKYYNALQVFDKLINTNKNYHKAYIYLKDIAEELKKQEQFISKYSKQINRDPLNPINYIKRGCLYFAKKNYKDTIRDCDKAIQLDPTYSMAFQFRANAKRYLNQDQQAIKDFSKAIQLNPNFSEAYKNRAVLYLKKKQWQLAINDNTKAIEINPMYSAAFNNRGIIYYLKKQIQKALSDYDKAIQINPLYYQAYYNRGLIYKQKLLIEQALGDFNKAIKLNPIYIDAYFNRGFLYNSKKQYTLALIDYNKVIQLNPSYWEAYNNRALLYQKLNKLQLAINDMKKVIQLHYLPKYLLKIGEWQFKLHKYQLAEAYLMKYVQLDRQNIKCYYYLGRIQLQKGNLELSSAYLEKSIEVIVQSKPQYFLYLGIVKDLMQKNDQANDNYEIAFGQRQEKKQCLGQLKQIYKDIHKFRCEDD